MKILMCGVLLQCVIVLVALPTAAEPARFTLPELTALAMGHNPQLDVAREQCLQGQGRYTQARAGYLPRVALDGTLGNQYIDELTPVDEDTVVYGGVNLSQLIYDFGKTTGAMDAARFSVLAAQANLEQYAQSVVFALRAAFYRVLEKQRLVEVADVAVANYAQHLYRARRYFESGVRTRIDVTNAQVSLSNAKLDLVKAQSDLESARVSLERVLGMRPSAGSYQLDGQEGPLAGLAEGKPSLRQSTEQLLPLAFANRADMRQVSYLIDAGTADIRRARADYFPSIGAEAGLASYETDLSSLRDQWSVGLTLRWEIFSGLATQGSVVEAKAKYRELQAYLADLEQQVTSEVTENYLRARENRDGVDLASATLTLAEENLQLAEGRYTAGLGDMLEFMDAQLSLTQAQSDLVTTYYAYLIALARIELSTGITSGLVAAETGGQQCRLPQWQPEP